MGERFKDRSYGNRGMPFENFLRFANDRYKFKRLAVISKQATEFKPIRDWSGKIVNVKVEEKAPMQMPMELDEEMCSVLDYFEIFLERMNLCRRAAEKLGLKK